MTSGVKVPQCVKDIISEVKKDHKYQTVLVKLTDKNDSVEVIKQVDRQSFPELVDMVKEEYGRQPLYIIHDFKGCSGDCITYISWCNDDSPIKKKMVHAATNDAMKKECDGFKLFAQATDFDELKDLEEKMDAKTRV